jgi:hypothetical protein
MTATETALVQIKASKDDQRKATHDHDFNAQIAI